MGKLDDIKNALDETNNATALQLVTSFLKKNKDHHEGKALKALALLRLQRVDEADEILKELREASNTGSDVQALLICYRENGMYEEIKDVYKEKYEKDPNDLEIAAQYFMSLVRVHELGSLFNVAMKMYKQDSSPSYYYWAVMGLYLEGMLLVKQEQNIPGTMKFTLAKALIEKAIDNKDFNFSREGLQLYIMILQAMGLHEQVLEVLKKDEGKAYAETQLFVAGRELDELLLACFGALDRHDEALTLARKQIEENADNWVACTTMMSIATATGEYDYVEAFFSKQYEASKTASPPQRGPLLACLEWHARCKFKTSGGETKRVAVREPSLPSVEELFLQLFSQFGHKRSFFSDARPYLSLLPDANSFISMAQRKIEIDMKDDDAWRNILRHVALAYCGRVSGCDGKESNESNFERMVKLFEDSKKSGEVLAPSELRYGDGYVQLAVHYALKVGSEEMVDHALSLVRDAVTLSGSNPQLRLLLVKLLIYKGDISTACEHWDALEVKQIQFDSIGYVLFDHVTRRGEYDVAHKLYPESRKFFLSGGADVPEYLCRAFKYGSFHKVEEFASFLNKINRSLESCLCACDAFLLNLIRTKIPLSRTQSIAKYNARSMPSMAQMEDDSYLSDNTQLDVMETFEDLVDTTSNNDMQLMRKARLQYTKLRFALFHVINSILNESHDAMATMKFFKQSLEKMEAVCEEVYEKKKHSFGDFSFGIGWPRCMFLGKDELSAYKHFAVAIDQIVIVRKFVSNTCRGQEMKDEGARIVSSITTGFEALANMCLIADDVELTHTSLELLSVLSLLVNLVQSNVSSETLLGSVVNEKEEVILPEIKMNKTVKQKLKLLNDGFGDADDVKSKYVGDMHQRFSDLEQAAATVSDKHAYKNFKGVLKGGCFVSLS
eukprot:m.59746 g.59746  ORF g.59746 m.59746 type:complete len:897 (-) comp7921_c0_seq1:192-2882(-)